MGLDRTLLAKLCGMFGSAHDGERAAAALKADSLVRTAGTTWHEVLKPTTARRAWDEPRTFAEKVSRALCYPYILTDWENNFLRDVNGRTSFSPKQHRVIDRIIRKVREHERTA